MAGTGLGITIKVLGVAKAQAKLAASKMQAQDYTPLWNKAIIILEKSGAKTFRMQGRPRWKPSQRALLQHGKTLRKTNRLMQSVTAKSGDSVRDVRGNSLRFGTRVVYAAVHQFGYGPDGIPKRPFLGIYDEDMKMIRKVMTADIDQRIRRVTT